MADSRAVIAKRLRDNRKKKGESQLLGVWVPESDNDYLNDKQNKHLKPKIAEYATGLVEQHKKEGGKDEEA